MGLFSKKVYGGGLMDVIRCDETQHLIWKWHPEGTVGGENRKENAIRFGSTLRVKEGMVAVFVYKQPSGVIYDYIPGPYDGVLETKNLPVISRIIGLAYAGESPFQAEVYFLNLGGLVQLKIAVPYFDVFEPRYLDFAVPIAVRGSITFQINNYIEFINLYRLQNLTYNDFYNELKTAINRNIKSIVTNVPEECSVPVLQLERKIELINDQIYQKLKGRLKSEFGIDLNSVDIDVLDIDKTSDGYDRLIEITRNLTYEKVKAATEVDIKQMHDNQRLDVYERTKNIDDDSYSRRKQTQSMNLNAYRTETQENIGVAFSKGVGSQSVSSGFNAATLAAEITIGNTIGSNIAEAMKNTSVNSSAFPNNMPPINNDKNEYFIAIDKQPTGPYDVDAIKSMVLSGEISDSSLIWRDGMTKWLPISEVISVKAFPKGMPPIPD